MKAHLKAGKYTGGTMLNVIALLLKYYKDYGFDFCQPQELVDSAKIFTQVILDMCR